MQYKTIWNSIKNIKTSTNSQLFFSIEKEYCSNDSNIPDLNRYYIRIQDGIDEFYTFIIIDDPANTDQADFETNYKPSAIET